MKSKTVIRCLTLTLWMLVLLASDGFAHPHAFIVDRLSVVFDDQGMADIRVHWILMNFFPGC